MLVMRYKIVLNYDGAPFCGWQIQPSAPSVQETLEKALSTLLKETVAVTGAGRTDTGVNARDYVAHFDAAAEFEPSQLTYRLNAILPSAVSVSSVEPVGDDFHARFDAVRREYKYYLHRKKNPFVDRYSWFCGYPEMDFDAMNRAAGLLLGTHDFSCFEKSGGDNKTSVCTIVEARWEKMEEDPSRWVFTVAADRFLRNMVRAIVGTLVEVGRGKRTVESISSLIERGTRSDSGESVPGNALFLNRIDY